MKINKLIKALVIVSASLVMALSVCSCSSKEESENSYWYYSVSTMIQSPDDYQGFVKGVYFDNDNYYIVNDFNKDLEDGTRDVKSEIFKVNQDGKIDGEFVIPDAVNNAYLNTVHKDKYYSVDYDNVLYAFNLSNGQIELNKNLPIGNCKGLYSVDDGLVIISDDEIILCSYEGEEISKVPAGNMNVITYGKAFFKEEDKFYVACGDNSGPKYYEVDFDNKTVKELFSAASNISATYFGDMAFTNTGVYKVDVEGKSLIPITEWNYCDIKPSLGSAIETDYALGQDIFAKVYSYRNGDIELLTFQKHNSKDYDSRKILTIGGYGVSDSNSIKWAIYNYNCSQDKYRVFVDEYNYKYGYQDAYEAQSSLLKLIRYFNEGNAPDIFYGFGFDYRYFYKSGMVIDMYPLMKEDKDFNSEDICESVLNTFVDDGVCYQVYSGYTFNGDFGLKEVFGYDDVTCLSIKEYAQDKGIPVDFHSYANDYVDNIIRYSFDDVMSKGLSEEQLKEILVQAKENESVVGQYEDWVRAVADGKCVTFMSFVSGLYDVNDIEANMNKSVAYLGRPSIYGTKHIVDPEGLVAISSGTNYQSECWDFIKCMFNEDVQKSIVSYGLTPVNKNVINEYVEYAKDPSKVGNDYIMHNYFFDKKAVPEWVIEDYLDMVNSVDSVITYDWGIYNIISEEVNAYVQGNKSIDDVAKSLKSRLTLYWSENNIN